MIYLRPEMLPIAFRIVYERASSREKAPNYAKEAEGMKKLIGVLDGVKMDHFYPGFFDKATYLLIQVNKGHFFSNGNKRLALVLAFLFIVRNGYDARDLGKEEYREALHELFPAYYSYEDYLEFSSVDFAYYNLSLIVAESAKYTASFEDLKMRVKAFLIASLEKKPI